jgi:hypothetical protein
LIDPALQAADLVGELAVGQFAAVALVGVERA